MYDERLNDKMNSQQTNVAASAVERLVTRETFATDGQYNKYLKIKAFFEKLIDLKKEGHLFMVDGELYTTPFVEGVEMGFIEGNCRLMYVGSTHTFNKKTGVYDIPWVDVTLKELRGSIVPMKRVKL